MRPAKTAPATTSKPKDPVLPTGWVCPKCGAVMAPHVNGCTHCNRPDSRVMCGGLPLDLLRY